MRRFEIALAGFFLATWVVAVLARLRVVDVAGRLDVGLYGLYIVAASAGWLLGNVWVARARGSSVVERGALMALYYLGPAGALDVTCAMAVQPGEVAAPLVPFLAFAVFTVFFLVPLAFRARSPRRPRIGGDREPRD